MRDAVENSSDDNGWANLGPVGSNIAKQSPDFDPRNYGYGKLSALVAATKLFEVELRGDGGSRATFVRNKKKKS